MKTNMGNLDRYLRALIVAVFFVLVNLGVVTGTGKIVLGLLGIVLILTALIGVCPMYNLIGINTCPLNK